MALSNTLSKKEQILNLKDEYFQQNTKNTLFKKSQKFDCAQKICQQMDLDDLLYHTAWIIPNTNKVYIDYSMLKLYANPSNFSILVEKFMSICIECSNNFPYFEVHLNLDTFTISAAERYKGIIEMFCYECFTRDTRFTARLIAFHIYNTPSVIDNISKIVFQIIPPEMRTKFVLHSKADTPTLLQQLHHQNT